MIPDILKMRVARFAVVGGIGFVVDAGMLHLILHVVGPYPVAGRVVSILAAMTVTWWLNRRFTFAQAVPPCWAEWRRYLVVNAVGAALNFGVYTLLMWLLQVADLVLRAWISVAVASLAAMVLNYLGMKHAVFTDSNSPKTLK